VASDFSIADAQWTFSGSLSFEADAFLAASNTEFNKKQQDLHEKYLAGQKRYGIDLESGVLTVTLERDKVDFDVKLLGSCRGRDNSWEWAWNNPNVDRSQVLPKNVLKPLVDKYQLRYLAEGAVKLPNNKFPWYLGGIALKVSPDAVGIYEAVDGDMRYFFVLYSPRKYPLSGNRS
jgi:hypothetical protein